MRRALIRVHGVPGATLTETEDPPGGYLVEYLPEYKGPPVSLTLPPRDEPYRFDAFPTFFDGLLPEGMQLEALLRRAKIDRQDLFAQLLAVGGDLVGAVTVEAWPKEKAE